jgi:hypothetical protein
MQRPSFNIIAMENGRSWPIAADPEHYRVYALRVATRSARLRKAASA